LLSILFVLNFDCDSHVLHYCRTIYSVTICSSWSFDNICWELEYGRCRVLILTQKSKSISNKTLLFYSFIFESHVFSQRPTTWKLNSNNSEAMFIFWNLFFEELFFKLSCICLPLRNLVNRKHFPIKEKFGLVSRKMFSWKIWAENTFCKLWKI